MKKIILCTVAVVCVLSFATMTFAETKKTDDEWHFILAPLFLWGVSVDGTAGVGPVTNPISLDFQDDVLENLAAAFTVHFEASKKDWNFFAEYQYYKLDPSFDTNAGPSANLDFEVQSAELGVAYQVGTFGINDLQVLGGARYMRQDLDLSLKPGPQLFDISDNWWDGFIGLRIFTHITDNWTFVGRGDIGAGDSDFVWNLMAMFDYQFKNWGSVFFGYRWLDYDYEGGSGRDRFKFDATLQGPLAGLAFYW